MAPSTVVKRSVPNEERTKTEQTDWWYGTVLAVVGALWLHLVTQEVDGPYLDEYFHIRQALVYYADKWTIWDPKITTPPGLYILSYPWLKLLGDVHAVANLRAFNTMAILLLWYTSNSLVRQSHEYRGSFDKALARDKTRKAQLGSTTSSHIALNIALFPPLFFFGALYYTDVVSALFVLKAHNAFYSQQPLWVFLWSLGSLSLRQTNIFWTAICLGALEIQRHLFQKAAVEAVVEAVLIDEAYEVKSFDEVARLSWRDGRVYDRGYEKMSLEDCVKTGLSLVLATLSRLTSLVVPLAPHVMVLGIFIAFVVWNGGVVLGDKSNHVASLHIPQMLYIWPYIVFFSFPVVATSLLSSYVGKRLPYPRPDTVIALLAAAIFWIAVNTIVHPFTLADNRHYTFYVFRILLRHPTYRFLAAPVYMLCGWGTLASFGGRTVTVLIWLSVTALSLITAPLVEPRYFILPWIMWRLQVGDLTFAAQFPGSDRPQTSFLAKTSAALSQYAIWIETGWYLLINLVTGYIFLHWKFEWPQEPGETMRFMW